MLVSAISMCEYNSGYNYGPLSYKQQTDQIGDTSFNALTPYVSRITTPQEKMPQVLEDINEWKNFCQNRILGQKLDIIA